MSTDSALIVRKDRLPTLADLTAAVAETGVKIDFPSGFRPDRTTKDWLAVTVNGDKTGFDYRVQSLADLAPGDLPPGATDCGDTVLWFGARGSLSAQTVSLIQGVLGRQSEAALLIDGELVPPAALEAAGEPSADLDPDFAATMRGTPTERAAAMDRYVAKHYPPVPRDRRAEAMNYLKTLTIPLIVILIFGALFVWTRLI